MEGEIQREMGEGEGRRERERNVGQDSSDTSSQPVR